MRVDAQLTFWTWNMATMWTKTNFVFDRHGRLIVERMYLPFGMYLHREGAGLERRLVDPPGSSDRLFPRARVHSVRGIGRSMGG